MKNNEILVGVKVIRGKDAQLRKVNRKKKEELGHFSREQS